MHHSLSSRSAGVLAVLTALALSGCGQSRDDSAPRADVSKTWVDGVRLAASSQAAAAGGATSGQTFDGWGHLKGRIVVVGGTVPAPPDLALSQDRAYCDPFKAEGKLRNESVIVSPQGELMNVAVYVSTKGIPAHESYKAAENQVVELDNKGCRFEPHVLLLRTTQKLRVKNSDTVGHNTKYDSLSQGFNANLPAGGAIEKFLTSEERRPTGYGCDVHKWMTGYLVLRAGPYMAKTAADGTFEIKNLPAGGKLEIELWHERLPGGVTGSVKSFTGTSTLTFEGGKLSVVIPKDDKTAEFTLEVPASAFGG